MPDFVPVTQASDAGLHSIEHLFEFWYDTSREEQRLRARIARTPITGGDYAGWFSKLHPVEYAAARSYDPAKAARVFERLARNGTHVTPTLTVHWTCDVPQDVPPRTSTSKIAHRRRAPSVANCSATGCASPASWPKPAYR